MRLGSAEPTPSIKRLQQYERLTGAPSVASEMRHKLRSSIRHILRLQLFGPITSLQPTAGSGMFTILREEYDRDTDQNHVSEMNSDAEADPIGLFSRHRYICTAFGW